MLFSTITQLYTNINTFLQTMAEHYPRVEAPLLIHPTETSIHQHFDRIIVCVNRRREEMIQEFRNRMEDKRAAETARINTLEELKKTKDDLHNKMKDNLLCSMRDRFVDEMDAKMRDLQLMPLETELVFECDTRQLEQSISVIGQLIEKDVIPTPDYPALLQPSLSVGNKGSEKGELEDPNAVTFDEKSQLIYLADGGDSFKSNGSISVFSIAGEYIDTLCRGLVGGPSGISISGNNHMFVSDAELHCILKFMLPKLKLVSKVGKKGKGVREFKYPRNLTISGRSVFLADSGNNRVVVMNTDLKHKHYITHQSMTYPSDLKVLNNNLFVLSTADDPCLHVFSLTGEKIRSLITRDGKGNAQVRRCLSFCLDKKQNILMADNEAENIRVFSREGALLHTLADTQNIHNIIIPTGITLTSDNKILCTSDTDSTYSKFGLHIF